MHFGLVAGYCDGELLGGEDGEPVTYQYIDFGVGKGEGGLLEGRTIRIDRNTALVRSFETGGIGLGDVSLGYLVGRREYGSGRRGRLDIGLWRRIPRG